MEVHARTWLVERGSRRNGCSEGCHLWRRGGEGLLEFMERTGRIELAGRGATWGSGEQQCSGWGLDEETTKGLNAQSVVVGDMAADAQLEGSGIGLAEDAALRRKALVGSSGAEQADGQRGLGRGASVGSGADVRLQGSEPGREHAQAHGKNLQNF